MIYKITFDKKYKVCYTGKNYRKKNEKREYKMH